MSRVLIAALVAAAVLAGRPAAAGADKQRVALIGNDDKITAKVRKAIAGKVELIETDGSAEADGSAEDARRLAQEHELHAVITVVTTGSKKRTEVEVSVLDGYDGERLGGYAVHGPRSVMPKRTAYRAWRKLKKYVSEARQPEPPAKEVAEAPPSEEDEPGPEVAAAEGASEASAGGELSARASARPRDGAPWLELSAEGASLLRSFHYKDNLNDMLREYELAAPAAALGAVWRPASSGALGHLALHGQVELAVGIEGSRTSDGSEYPTSASEWSAGARIELPIAGWDWTLDGSYGEHRFTIDDDDGMSAELLPDVAYRWARGGLGVRVPMTDSVAVDAGGGWRHLLDTGDLGSDAWFPRLTGGGVDAHLGAVWQISGPVALHGRADLRRYFFAMNPEPGDPAIAGGAIDQYLAIIAGLTVTLR